MQRAKRNYFIVARKDERCPPQSNLVEFRQLVDIPDAVREWIASVDLVGRRWSYLYGFMDIRDETIYILDYHEWEAK